MKRSISLLAARAASSDSVTLVLLFIHKEIKTEYQLEEDLNKIRNPADRVSITKVRLGFHSLRIQTGKSRK